MAKNSRAIKGKCEACGHHKLWEYRGNVDPTYKYKCTKCHNLQERKH